MKLRILVGTLATALAVGLLAPPAAADTIVRSDPVGDSSGPGNIVALRMSHSDDRLLLQIRTNRGIDKATAPAWNAPESLTQLRFNLDVQGDRKVDYIIVLSRSGGIEILAVAQSPTPRAPCAITSQPDPTIIRVRVAYSCIGIPEHVRVFARYRFDQGGNGSVDTDDRAPNTGYTPFLPIEA